MSSSNVYKGVGSDSAAIYELKQLLSTKAIKELKLVEQARDRERESKDRLERLEKDAYRKGFEAGEKAGTKLADEKAAGLINMITAVMNEITNYKEAYYAEHGEEIASIVGKATRKVVRAELKVNPDVVANVIEAAIRSVVTREEIVLRLNPEDHAYLKGSRPDFFESIGVFRKCRIEAAASVGRGGCMIESNHGEVDARIETALDALETGIKGTVKIGPSADKKDG